MELFAKIGKKLMRNPHAGLVRELKEPYWKRNRWHWNSGKTTLEGRYRTPYCAPKGKFSRHHDGTYTAYITAPPEELWRHKKHSCFYSTNEKDVYRVHFYTPPQEHTIDACIQYIERVLVESFETKR